MQATQLQTAAAARFAPPNIMSSAWGSLPFVAKAAVVGGVTWGFYEAAAKVSEKSLKGEVAVVTGAGSGIGRLLALALAREGARIAVWDVNAASAEAVVREIRGAGNEARAYICDVSQRDAVYALSGSLQAHGHRGRPDPSPSLRQSVSK